MGQQFQISNIIFGIVSFCTGSLLKEYFSVRVTSGNFVLNDVTCLRDLWCQNEGGFRLGGRMGGGDQLVARGMHTPDWPCLLAPLSPDKTSSREEKEFSGNTGRL